MLTPSRPYTVVLIVPTGIGAAVGGYAGDALPVAKAFSRVCDRLITHPNVMNGAQLYWPLENTLYVEGYGLDQFAAGRWGLEPVHQNKVGLILDQAIAPELRLRHLQAADATRATLGLSLTDYVVTDRPLNVELRTAESGASWGTIGQPDSLLRAAETLITKGGAEAIAVVARFPEDMDETALTDYRHGGGVDPLAGAEAVISHLVVREFGIPCAHAPALSPLPVDPQLSPKAAAEELGYTFLPCVLVGLSRAPRFHREGQGRSLIWGNQVDAVVVPAQACGGSGVLQWASQPQTKIITVADNTSRMAVSATQVGISAIAVQSYPEALGILLCDRHGINPQALTAHVPPLQAIAP